MRTCFHLRLALFPLALALAAPVASHCARGADVSDVRAAWTRRWTDVNAFEYQYELVRPPIGDRSIPLRTTATFTVSGNKIAYRTDGEEWDGPGRPTYRSTKHFVFDGSDSYSWIAGASVTLGDIVVGEASEGVVRFAEHLPFWLAYRPIESLERLGYSPKTMRLGRRNVEYAGSRCVEVILTVPNHPRYTALVYADPSRGYLPLGLHRQLGTIRKYNSLAYSPNDRVGWVVSAFSYEAVASKGELLASLAGRVTKCSINGPIPDATFRIAFPVGTHVARVHGDSKEYFVQLEGGMRQPISETQYGVVPHAVAVPQKAPFMQRRMLFPLCVAIVLILLVAAVLITRRRGR